MILTGMVLSLLFMILKEVGFISWGLGWLILPFFVALLFKFLTYMEGR
jgi:hypothetical protein